MPARSSRSAPLSARLTPVADGRLAMVPPVATNSTLTGATVRSPYWAGRSELASEGRMLHACGPEALGGRARPQARPRPDPHRHRRRVAGRQGGDRGWLPRDVEAARRPAGAVLRRVEPLDARRRPGDRRGRQGRHHRARVPRPQPARACGSSSFKVPTEEERAHDFLWRVHHQAPKHGEIGVFNRSHYEDVLVVRVHELVPEKVWRARYEHIRAFERLLTSAGTTVVKLFLHISKEEQRERLQARLDDPAKHWKFRARRPRGAGPLGRLPGGVRGRDPRDVDRRCPVVRRASRSQVVPQLGGAADPHRDARGDRPAVPAAVRGPQQRRRQLTDRTSASTSAADIEPGGTRSATSRRASCCRPALTGVGTP